MVEMCYKTHTTTVNPIVDWSTDEVWEFIKEYEIPYCSLYDEGFKRLGCIGCPMGSKAQRQAEFERWPKYKNLYMIAFQKMIERRGGRCENTTQQKNGGGRGCNHETADAWMYWYIHEGLQGYDTAGDN
jgi:phosphoadenosine phosphosulfate reductase